MPSPLPANMCSSYIVIYAYTCNMYAYVYNTNYIVQSIGQVTCFCCLQIHPSAFKQGGVPLVASCIYAAEQASVSGTRNLRIKL